MIIIDSSHPDATEPKVQYITISRLTVKQYEQIFVRQSMDEKSIEFREWAYKKRTKAERIFVEMGDSYNPKRFRELFFEEDKEIPKTLFLKDLFDYYIENSKGITLRTRKHFRLTKNKLESFQAGLTVNDITPEFLKHFERVEKDQGLSQSTINGIFRNLRRIINYFTHEMKTIPKSYEYPFGKGKYSIRSFDGIKLVMTQDEIKKVIDFNDFDNEKQEFARDIWLLLYRLNGSNFADLLKLRWDNIDGGYLIFFRKKTENTRKNRKKPIVSPLTPKLKELIDKVGVRESPFILGLLKEGYNEITFENLSQKIRRNLNKYLREIGNKLNLSVPLKLKTARDCYATTLKRSGVSVGETSEMMGHSNPVITEHYLASLDIEKTHEINQHIL